MLEDSIRRVHYLFRQWLSFLEFEEIVELYENMNGEFEDLSPRIMRFLENIVEEMLDGVDPLIEQSLIEAERYRSLPFEIRRLFEYDASSVFQVKKVVEDAFNCKETMKELTEHIRQKRYINQKCVHCEILRIIMKHRGFLYNQP